MSSLAVSWHLELWHLLQGNTKLDHSHRNSTDIPTRRSNNSLAVIDQPIITSFTISHTAAGHSIDIASHLSHSLFRGRSQPLASYQPGP